MTGKQKAHANVLDVLQSGFPDNGAPPPTMTKEQTEVAHSVYDWDGPPKPLLLLYPKERIIAGFWLLLKRRGDYNPHGTFPHYIGLTPNNEKRMVDQGLIKVKDRRVHAQTSLWSAYDVTYWWFQHLASKKKETDPEWFNTNWLKLYKYGAPPYITPQNRAETQRRPWTMIERLSKEIKSRHEFEYPTPSVPRSAADEVRRRHGINDFQVVPEQLIIKTREERAFMTHLYSVYSENDRRIVIPLAVLPYNKFVRENLDKDGFINIKETGDGVGALMTRKGMEAYEVTYFHHLWSSKMKDF